MNSGIHVVTRKRPGKVAVHYVYAWRGGPQVWKQEGGRKPKLTHEIRNRVSRAWRERPAPAGEVTLGDIVEQYLSSEWFTGLTDEGKSFYRCELPAILDRFGTTPLAAFEDPRMKIDIEDWRLEFRKNARKADKLVQVLRRVLNYGVHLRQVTSNPALGIKRLYSSNRSAIVWSEEDVRLFRTGSRASIAEALDLALCTGFRCADLSTVTWDAVSRSYIKWSPSKSRGRRTVFIPMLPETWELLERIRNRHAEEMAARKPHKRRPLPPTILSSSLWKPWGRDSLSTSASDRIAEVGLQVHLHDARGNFVTRLAKAGLAPWEIAGIVGWSVDEVDRMLKIYLHQDEVYKAMAEKIATVPPTWTVDGSVPHEWR